LIIFDDSNEREGLSSFHRRVPGNRLQRIQLAPAFRIPFLRTSWYREQIQVDF
jgi:hypothetical protein